MRSPHIRSREQSLLATTRESSCSAMKTQHSSVQLLSHVQASLPITNSLSLLKHMSIELVTPSNHLILCCPFLFLPSIFPSTRVFSNESVLRIRWSKYWSFSISPSNEYSGLISKIKTKQKLVHIVLCSECMVCHPDLPCPPSEWNYLLPQLLKCLWYCLPFGELPPPLYPITGHYDL